MQSGQRMQSIARLLELSEAARERRLAELVREQAQHLQHLDMLRQYRNETASQSGRDPDTPLLAPGLLRATHSYLQALDRAIAQGEQRAQVYDRDVERLRQECLQAQRRVRGIEGLAAQYLLEDRRAVALREDLAMDDYPRRTHLVES